MISFFQFVNKSVKRRYTIYNKLIKNLLPPYLLHSLQGVFHHFSIHIFCCKDNSLVLTKQIMNYLSYLNKNHISNSYPLVCPHIR